MAAWRLRVEEEDVDDRNRASLCGELQVILDTKMTRNRRKKEVGAWTGPHLRANDGADINSKQVTEWRDYAVLRTYARTDKWLCGKCGKRMSWRSALSIENHKWMCE